MITYDNIEILLNKASSRRLCSAQYYLKPGPLHASDARVSAGTKPSLNSCLAEGICYIRA